MIAAPLFFDEHAKIVTSVKEVKTAANSLKLAISIFVESMYPKTIPFIVVIRRSDPSCVNSILLTLPAPDGKSIVYWAISLKSEAEYTLTLFYPAITILLPLETAIASSGAAKTLLLVI